jgi:predicted Ser/Thr protein kinase
MSATLAMPSMSAPLSAERVLRGLALARALVPHDAAALRQTIEAGCRRLDAAGYPRKEVQRLRNYALIVGARGSRLDA